MPRKPNDIFYIYKTTNLINQKFYVGKHCTTKIENDYLGSGLILRRSIRKYGKENFKKEILEFCNDKEHLAQREKEIVNEEFLKESLCMNLKLGGTGGWLNSETQIKCSILGSKALQLKLKNDLVFYNEQRQKISKGVKKAQQENRMYKFNGKEFEGKKHTKESKQKIGMITSKAQSGNGNSQFGTMWITNGFENKKIKKDTIIPNDWYKGRK